MGRVEVAIETAVDGAGRIVALKRLLPEDARDARRKEMFLREAHLGSLLTHPNVVQSYAFGELEDELFLAMEYVEGEPLSRVLAALAAHERRLGESLTCHVLAEVCEGLHAAHELRDAAGKPLNVVHRDVSPHNVMIAYDGRVKLLDFGVAKLDVGPKTRTGEVKGKMAYMSPEQALGDPLDRRSDLFSVGAVLYECLVGRPMWGAGSDVELMRRLALEHAPELARVGASWPPALTALHSRLVARRPAERPQTAKQVADELRAHALERSAAHAELDALMGGLFAKEASERRASFDEAFARDGEPVASHEAARDARMSPAARDRRRPAPRAALWIAATLGTAAAALTAAGTMRSASPNAAPSAPAAPSAAAAPTPADTVAAAPPPSAAPLPTHDLAPPRKPAVAAPVAIGPRETRRAPGPPRTPVTPTSSMASTRKLPDVDKTPF
jgi:serine/threonine-protein kinase